MILYQKVKVKSKTGEYIGNISQIFNARKGKKISACIKISEVIGGDKKVGDSVKIDGDFIQSI